MRKEEKIIPATLEITTYYDQPGEGPEHCIFRVGQEVKTLSGSIRPSGKIVEILDSPDRQIFQLKLANGWCCHPDRYQYGCEGEEVVIIKNLNQ